jgi:hypothetical protein
VLGKAAPAGKEQADDVGRHITPGTVAFDDERVKQPKNGALHLVAEFDELARRRHDKRCGPIDPGLHASSHLRGLVAHEIDQGRQRQIFLERPLDQRATLSAGSAVDADLSIAVVLQAIECQTAGSLAASDLLAECGP